MNANTSTVAASAALPASVPTPAVRETRQTTLLIAGALGLGGILQVFIEPGPWALVVGVSAAGGFLFLLSQVLPGKWRETLAGFRFTATLLFALAVTAVAGTLILQNKPMAFYESRYGAVGSLIVALRLDDIFHSLWFAGFIALFFAAVLNSALLRWPVKLRNAGFFTCHVGLLTSLVGAGASAAFAVKGRVDLHAGGQTARQVMATKNGVPTGQVVPLGFDLRLDKFDLVRYSPEYRVAYYELVGDGARLKASFDIGTDELASERVLHKRHLLPSGDSFRIKKLQLDVGGSGTELRNPAVVLEVTADGDTRETGQMLAAKQDYVRTRRGALVFERREDEVKAFQSQVTAFAGATVQKAQVNVNDPFTFNGWTFYQVNYDPKDPTYSGLEAVRDPGVNLVFLGFAVICLGVFYMFYVEPRLKRAGARA
jgi:hypothetical protein